MIAAATKAEIGPTLDWLRSFEEDDPIHDRIGVCITGVGLMAATYALTCSLTFPSVKCVIGAGIGGAYDKSLSLGECVVIQSEQLADLGAEDGEAFIDLFDMGFADRNVIPFTNGKLVNPLEKLPFSIAHLKQKTGLTVLTASGRESTIAQRLERYGADVESMEGAALHYVCGRLGLPFIQLRAISNYVTRRDRSAWRIGDAVDGLNAQLLEWLK